MAPSSSVILMGDCSRRRVDITRRFSEMLVVIFSISCVEMGFADLYCFKDALLRFGC